MAKDVKVPKDVESRVSRARERMLEGAPKRNECLEFWRGNQYAFLTSNNQLQFQNTTQGWGQGRPRHRVRNTRNLLLDHVAHEVSQASQRVPSYEISPSTVDPEDVAAARLGEKVARYGYDAWRVRDATVGCVTFAVVADEGFVWPYFDNTIGPAFEAGGQSYRQGDVRLLLLGPNEVAWEPGCRFDDSPYHVVENAMPLQQVYGMPGYLGGELSADASSNTALSSQRRSTKGQMVMVTQYLERPCPKYPLGRRIVMANNRVICRPENYPCVDGRGDVVDEPVLHKLAYFLDPDSDRDMGLVRHALDPMRTYNDAANKTAEWKNLALNPQVLVPIGAIEQPLTDEPGAMIEYKPIMGQVPQWRPVPPIPPELFTIQDRAANDLARIFAQNEIPGQVESGKAIQSLIERDQSRRQEFLARLAEFHSRLMRHCLYLVQRHYSEPRLLNIRGRFGPESISGFRGAMLRGQADVTVLPGSIEPRTRQAVEQRVLAFADRGWVSPEAAMSAINGGTAEALVESYELDVARANMVIQKIRSGPDAFLSAPTRPDGTPSWMPRKFDNLDVHKSVFEDWMKTSDYEYASAPVQEAANLYYDGLEWLTAEKAQQEMAAQSAQAESLGMENAAKPQQATPTPDQRKPEPTPV